jgi:hypothetical protein
MNYNQDTFPGLLAETCLPGAGWDELGFESKNQSKCQNKINQNDTSHP